MGCGSIPSVARGSRMVLVTCLALSTSCTSVDDRAPAPGVTGTGAPGAPRVFPASALRLDGPADLVLAEGRHGIELTLREYNARAEEFTLPADLEVPEARRRYLQLLVDHKVVATEGRLRGYAVRAATTTLEEENELANQVIRAAILEAQSVHDDEARAFFEEHRDDLPGIEPRDLDDPATMLHVKFTMHNHRWEAAKQKWTDREDVVVHLDRFLALVSGSPDSVTLVNEEMQR
jgi:hypothetical protein